MKIKFREKEIFHLLNKITMKKIIFTNIFTIALLNISFSQETWMQKNPFEHKVFIENKGQFATANPSSGGFDTKNNLKNNPIKYAYSSEGVEIYFTNKGLTYRHDEIENVSENEKGSGEKEREEKIRKVIPHFAHMDWVGANPHAQIIAEDAVTYYFTYPNLNDKSGKTSLKASAYKKIIYKNLYPNIDVEYTFPENKEGIKYAIILHPNADASSIKMNYYQSTSSLRAERSNLTMDEHGNIQISTPLGNIIDHAPISYYKEGSPITSSFNNNNNIVTFQLSNYDHSRTIIIDPWTTNPSYPGYNAGYDVDYDFQGNAYIYGGASPFQEIKFNSSGVMQWVYTELTFTVAGYYGDFAVDGNSGSSYIVEAYRCCGQGTRVRKVGAMGAQIGLFPGDVNIQEMWRIVFNNCTRQAIIAGTSFVNPTYYQACILDTNVSAITPVNVLSSSGFVGTDMCMLALDNSNNCFMADVANDMLRCSANTLSPTAFVVPDNHPFLELMSVAYINNTIPSSCAMNAMAVSNNYLYTYDGSLIQRWNKNTGVLINSATIGSVPFRWGGIAVDDCDNIYVGMEASVVHYDTNFTVVSTIPMANNTDTVYDLKLAPNNLLFVCGLGFVSSIQLNGVPCNGLNLTMSSVDACSGGQGSASVIATGGTSPYIYLWNPTGQTTQTANGLSAGTYSVTVTDNSCIPKSQTNSVTVNVYPLPNTNAGADTTIIKGSNTTLAATGINCRWTPTTWLSDSTICNPVATPNVTTTYILTVTDTNGCTNTDSVTVFVIDKKIDSVKCGELFIPTAFSPNGDGQNDVLYVRGNCIKDFSLTIYDRWGEKVFETNDIAKGWDGNYKSGSDSKQSMSTAVFVYYLTATLSNENKISRKGNISLVK